MMHGLKGVMGIACGSRLMINGEWLSFEVERLESVET